MGWTRRTASTSCADGAAVTAGTGSRAACGPCLRAPTSGSAWSPTGVLQATRPPPRRSTTYASSATETAPHRSIRARKRLAHPSGGDPPLSDHLDPGSLTRRGFFALGGGATAAALLAACGGG